VAISSSVRDHVPKNCCTGEWAGEPVPWKRFRNAANCVSVWSPGICRFELQNQKGEIIGFDVDMAAVMAKAMGVKLELVSTAWDGIIPALLTDKFDVIMSGMTLTQERNMSINFAPPYIVIGQTVLLKKDLAETVKSYKDLNDRQIHDCLETRHHRRAGHQAHDPRRQVYQLRDRAGRRASNWSTGRSMPSSMTSPTMLVAIGQKGQGKIVHLDTPFTFEPIAWGIRKGDPDFLNWLENFMYQIKNDGTYDTAVSQVVPGRYLVERKSSNI
jgi:polar amino acid transport system substrate-binding protein